MKIKLIFLLTLIFNVQISAQHKVMSPDTYLEWNRIRSVKVSDNGVWVKYHLQREKGDKTLKLYDTNDGKTYTFDRVKASQIDRSSSYIVFTIGTSYEEERRLQRRKVDKKDMPADTLCIYNMKDRLLTKVPNVESFQLPEYWSGYLAYLKAPEAITDTLSQLPKETHKSGTKLIVQNLKGTLSDTLLYTKTYHFAKNDKGLAAHSVGIDSLMDAGLYHYDFDKKQWTNIFETKGDLYNVTWADDARQLALTIDRDTSEVRIRPYELLHWQRGTPKAKVIGHNTSSYLPQDHIISNHATPEFSEDGNQLIFGIAPLPILQDTSLLDDEIVNVEVWHYDDTRLYTREENDLKNDKKRFITCIYDISSSSVNVLQQDLYDRILFDEEHAHAHAIGIVTEPYKKYEMWEGHGYFDAYKVNVKNGSTEQFLIKERGNPSRSPSGKYIVWYDAGKRVHKSYNVDDNKISNITSEAVGTFYDERNDRPMDPRDYRYAGFTTDEKYILMYDRYDIWRIDPKGNKSPQRITDGRKNKTIHRYIDLDKEESIIDINNPIWIHTFNEQDKSEGYISLDLNSKKITKLYSADKRIDRTPIKSKDKNVIITTTEDYDNFPNLQLTDLKCSDMMQISDANPQQSEYNWGAIRLHSWVSAVGDSLDGLLVLPDNFDPAKKYPMIVNFYERSSDRLHSHRAPYAGRSTINYSYYSSKGYVIFNPDVVYRNGYPGQSCYDAVLPGVASVIELGFIDEDRIGLQGHSWGGYQIADLLTKTDIFRCAESGAPVVNMVSAYGGIRWGSGRSRMFQYEKTQSRLGATLWERPDLYIENSPIFNLDKVTTPVLILHNDKDGAVPWYQGIEYFNGLRRLEKKAWLLNYNDEPHWPVKWQNKLDFNIRMEQFFDHYLMDAPAPRWMKRGVPAIEKGIRQGLELDKE